MAAIKKVKKAQYGMQLDSTGKRFPKANVPASARTPTAPPPNKVSTSGIIMKSKTGGSFPDLNKDGKITKADILKGRGVIAKTGATMKKTSKTPKAQAGYKSMFGEKTADSTKYYDDQAWDYGKAIYNLRSRGVSAKDTEGYVRGNRKALADKNRQKLKGIPGYDKNGFPVKKNKIGGMTAKKKLNMGGMMKTGGKMTKTCKYGCK